MTKDYKRFYKEISSWDWSNIQTDCEENVAEDDDGQQIGQCFLGTCFHLAPSGKYYMPWVCSNVDACPRCKGKGTLPNPRKATKRFDRLSRKINRIVKQMLNQYGCYPEWPKNTEALIQKLRAKAERFKPELECPLCHGAGSHEAYLDQEWFEALEACLDEHGMFFQTGEGDPCDYFAAMVMEKELNHE